VEDIGKQMLPYIE